MSLLAHKEKAVSESLLDEDLIKIGNYFYDNEFIINLKKGKTESMLFATLQRLRKTGKAFKASYHQKLINFVEEHKYLWNIVDNNLTFSSSFSRSYKKAISLIKFIANTRKSAWQLQHRTSIRQWLCRYWCIETSWNSTWAIRSRIKYHR